MGCGVFWQIWSFRGALNFKASFVSVDPSLLRVVSWTKGATNLGWFMAGRVVQGLAASVYVVVLASMRDCYEDPASSLQAMGTMMTLILIGPIFAPGFGGLLGSYFGWRFPFGLLTVVAVLLAFTSCIVVTETAAAREHSSKIAKALAATSKGLMVLCSCRLGSLFQFLAHPVRPTYV